MSKIMVRKSIKIAVTLGCFLSFTGVAIGRCDAGKLVYFDAMESFSFVFIKTIKSIHTERESTMKMAYEIAASPPNYFKLKPRPDLVDGQMPIQYSVVCDGQTLWQAYQAGQQDDEYHSLAVSSNSAPNHYRDLFRESRLKDPKDLAPTMGYFQDLIKVLRKDVDIDMLKSYGEIIASGDECCLVSKQSIFEERVSQKVKLCFVRDTHLLSRLAVTTERGGTVVQEVTEINDWSFDEIESEAFSFDVPDGAKEVDSIFEFLRRRTR